MKMFENGLQFLTPFIYVGLFVLPFLFKKTLFSKSQTSYNDVIIVFVNINRLTTPTENESNPIIHNPYYDEGLTHLEIYLENENDYNMTGVLTHDIFKNQTVNPYNLEKNLFELRDFCDYCIEKLDRKPFVMVNTNDSIYEIFISEYGVPNVINLKRMYGFFNTDDESIPPLTPITLLNEIVTKKYSTMETTTMNKADFMVKLLESW
jgi:hypothetical protein